MSTASNKASSTVLDCSERGLVPDSVIRAGIRPSYDLPLRFQENLRLLRHDRWSGSDYEQTANAWLVNMDVKRARIMTIMAETYGVADAERWFQRWRIFFMACAELFAFNNGSEWFVSHYLVSAGKT